MRSNRDNAPIGQRNSKWWGSNQSWNTIKSAPLYYPLIATWFAHISVIMSEEQDQNNSLIDESDNDSEPAVHHQMNPRVEAKINALCQQTGLIMKQVVSVTTENVLTFYHTGKWPAKVYKSTVSWQAGKRNRNFHWQATARLVRGRAVSRADRIRTVSHFVLFIVIIKKRVDCASDYRAPIFIVLTGHMRTHVADWQTWQDYLFSIIAISPKWID